MTGSKREGPGFGRVRRTLRRIRLQRGGAATPILIRKASTTPEAALAMRGLLVLVLVLTVFSVFLLDRAGLRDNIDGNVSVIDVIYFTMITITTVGYGDIVPVSDHARLIDAFFVTPVLIVLTIRALSKDVRTIANVSEPENIKLVKAGGADIIVSPPRFGGVLMADAVESHTTVDFVSELISYRGSYQLVEREPRAEEIGRDARDVEGALIVEVRRGGRRIGCWHEKNLRIEAGDRVLAIDSEAVLKASLA